MEGRLRTHVARGMPLGTVLDVGAHFGEFAALVRRVAPAATCLSFEADPDCEPHLRSAGVRHRLCCLGRQAGQAAFYKSGTSTGNSLYRENTRHFDACDEVTLDVCTLDHALAGEADFAGAIDLLKLDVQGAELDVLVGAPDTLRRTQAVLAECAITEYNLGAPRMLDVMQFLDGCGFEVADICELHYDGATLVQVDVLFRRTQPGTGVNTPAFTRPATA